MTAYTMYLNKKYNRVGHVFQGRFSSIIVEKETYFLQVLRYIHLNPVKASLVKRPENYKWSSYLDFLSSSEEFSRLPKVEVKETLGFFSSDFSKQRELFQEFTLAGITDSFDPFKEQVRGFLGGEKFIQKLTKISTGDRP